MAGLPKSLKRLILDGNFSGVDHKAAEIAEFVEALSHVIKSHDKLAHLSLAGRKEKRLGTLIAPVFGTSTSVVVS